MLRKHKQKCLLVIVTLTLFYTLFIYTNLPNQHQIETERQKRQSKISKKQKKPVFLAMIVCGTKLDEALNSMKSAIIFSRTTLFFFVFTNGKLDRKINNTLTQWKVLMNNKFDFELRKVKLPKDHLYTWLRYKRKYGIFKLFIPWLLRNLDSIIYVDADTIWFGAPEKLWQNFDMFDLQQVAGMSEDPYMYPGDERCPVFGLHGLNSGVILMNLTRMRAMNWQSRIAATLLKYEMLLVKLDQSIINIIFNQTPSALAKLPCHYNYRMEHCRGDRNVTCPSAIQDGGGVLIVHGTGRSFFPNGYFKVPEFQAIYNATSLTEVNDTDIVFFNNIKNMLHITPESTCKSRFMKMYEFK